jgi:hypothetical protein
MPKATRLYWAAIREDLRRDENVEALHRIRQRLREIDTPPALRLSGLSDVRLLDILAWQMRLQVTEEEQ